MQYGDLELIIVTDSCDEPVLPRTAMIGSHDALAARRCVQIDLYKVSSLPKLSTTFVTQMWISLVSSLIVVFCYQSSITPFVPFYTHLMQCTTVSKLMQYVPFTTVHVQIEIVDVALKPCDYLKSMIAWPDTLCFKKPREIRLFSGLDFKMATGLHE
jgi:hypothetical protein